MEQKRIVTIQDLSCFGKCSLGVALPVISALGIETVALPTAILSTHTGGFQNYTFCDLTEEMPEISQHWQRLDIEFDAIYVGYLGSIHQLKFVEAFIERFKKENTIIFVDPVMADNGELYSGFNDEFVKEMRKLCKKADVICPNITEACFLGGIEYRDNCTDREYINSILNSLRCFCNNVILTSVGYDDETCGTVAQCDDEIIEVFRQRINGHFYGAGDLFASAFIGKYTKCGNIEKSLNLATDFVAESIKKTLDEKEKYWYGLKFEQALDLLIQNEKEGV